LRRDWPEREKGKGSCIKVLRALSIKIKASCIKPGGGQDRTKEKRPLPERGENYISILICRGRWIFLEGRDGPRSRENSALKKGKGTSNREGTPN